MSHPRTILYLDTGDVRILRRFIREATATSLLLHADASFLAEHLDEAEGLTREPGIRLVHQSDGGVAFVWDQGLQLATPSS